MKQSFRIGRRALIGWTLMAGTNLSRVAGAMVRRRAVNAGPARAATLADGFRSPPAAARPRTWWHWMNGNVTLDGIEKDLAWMHRVGIGGVHVFDAALDTPRIVERPVKYMSPEWKAAFRHSATLLDGYGMEMGVAASPGWSETGGPWVEPKDAMKKLVWTETTLDGGKRQQVRLPQPPSAPGVFQDIAIPPPPVGASPPIPPHYYEDVFVFAYPDDGGDRNVIASRYADTAGATLDASILSGDNYANAVTVPSGAQRGIVADLGTAREVRSAEFYAHDVWNMFFGSPLRPVLDASADGKTWAKVCEIVICGSPTTVSFAPLTARYLRVRFPAAPDTQGTLPPTIKVARLRFSSAARINAFEAKAAFSILPSYSDLDAAAGPDVAGIDTASVIDLTDRVSSGVLDWTPPAGRRWRVVRMGASLTGKQNHPAVPEGTGLEVDKYSARAVRAYINRYLDMYADAVGSGMFGDRGLQALLTDSTEVGASNWTPGLLAHFKRLRGYDPRPWLPTLIGVIVKSRSSSDGFLYDFRRTLSDLMASEHYGTIAEVGRERGLFVYAESLEAGRPTLGDDLDMRRFADIPMAALWTWDRSEASTRPALIADCKGASSVAHIYGQNVAAAESMTSGNSLYAQSPSDLKRVVDLEFALGINRLVIHTSPHQPLDDKQPGLSLQVFGQAFTRHNTWADLSKPWLDYMARTSFLLQQGRDVADVAYFYGEDGSPTALYQMHLVADAPRRYAFDYVGALPLATIAQVENGELTFPSGARYRVLYLGGSSRRVTLPTLRRLETLARAGLTIVGRAPAATPSGADDPIAFAQLRDLMWSGKLETPIGRGRTIAMDDVEAALERIGVVPDFTTGAPETQGAFMFVHRKIADADLYFVNNRENRGITIAARFRATGRQPVMWRADTGETRPLSYRTQGAHTVIDLDVEPEDAFFVIFDTPSATLSRRIEPPTLASAPPFGGAWQVSFEPGRGAPTAGIRMPRLLPLNEASDAGVRYFSGIATYKARMRAADSWRPGHTLLLDLGVVGEIAEVFVNGAPVGIVWKAPYRVDVSDHWRTGDNEVEVRVANLWLNRLIGDLQPGVKRIAYASTYTMTADTPLRASGLIGPVCLWMADAAA